MVLLQKKPGFCLSFIMAMCFHSCPRTSHSTEGAEELEDTLTNGEILCLKLLNRNLECLSFVLGLF